MLAQPPLAPQYLEGDPWYPMTQVPMVVVPAMVLVKLAFWKLVTPEQPRTQEPVGGVTQNPVLLQAREGGVVGEGT
jgi:hypothetical protein